MGDEDTFPDHRYLKEAPVDSRLEDQLRFVGELDRLKKVLRQTPLTDGSRRENSAEHSWHLAVMALVLEEYAAEDDLDLVRVLKMLVIHDVVEIEAGDTFRYDEDGMRDKEERERQAARELFGLLPDDQSRFLRELWREFERRETPEARYAAALDRLQPLLHNFLTRGRAWREHGVRKRQVIEGNRLMKDGVPDLWSVVRDLLDRAAKQGDLEE